MAQIIRITSEALQATIRRLLPSQQGFGEDLQASNVIQPIIDLTPTAEGSQLQQNLAEALAFGSQTEIFVQNSNVVVANTPGFYRFFGYASVNPTKRAFFKLENGLSTKTIFEIRNATAGLSTVTELIDFVFFLDTGDSCAANSSDANTLITGSVRQIADRYGNVSNPSGFTFE